MRIDGAYVPLPIQPETFRDSRARPAAGGFRRRQRDDSAQARRLRGLRRGGRHRAAGRRGEHAAVPGRTDHRQQHRRLGLRRQPARARRRPRRRPGAAAGRGRLGARHRGGAAGGRRAGDGRQPHAANAPPNWRATCPGWRIARMGRRDSTPSRDHALRGQHDLAGHGGTSRRWTSIWTARPPRWRWPTSSTCRWRRRCWPRPRARACEPSTAWACCCTRRSRVSRAWFGVDAGGG